MIEKKKTVELLNILNNVKNKKELSDYVEELHSQSCPGSFAEYILTLPKFNNISRAELIRRSGIDRTYGYQLLEGRKIPGRDKVIALALAAGLNLTETQRALRAAGCDILYPRSSRDAVFIFAINRKMDVITVNETLVSYNEPPLS